MKIGTMNPIRNERRWVLPLPKGEGWGEGEGIVCQPTVDALTTDNSLPLIHHPFLPPRQCHFPRHLLKQPFRRPDAFRFTQLIP
jgi:hypothetical protein